MEALPLNKMKIFSDKGTYDLCHEIDEARFQQTLRDCEMCVVDQVVYELHKDYLAVDPEKVIVIEVSEEIKGPHTALKICEQLVAKGVRRKDRICAVGGGVIQDLATFAASILFRGIDWVFVPTTLLAQSDSCIGGKSSLNLKEWKNILGNFYPPNEIYIQSRFLGTLAEDDIRSGVGEMIKVHLLSGVKAKSFLGERIADCYSNRNLMSELILSSLVLKNKILEIDPLDQGLRLKMNYGHSFGHALESATNFEIPHGIAVTIGLDIANFISSESGYLGHEQFEALHNIINVNLKPSDFVPFDFDKFIVSLKRDKKNTKDKYMVVIPVADGEVEVKGFEIGGEIEMLLKSYISKHYNRGHL